MDAYLARTHLIVTYRNAFEGPADTWLAARGKRRKVMFATTRFAVLPSLLREPATMATVPEAIAERWRGEHGLAVVDCPVPLDEVVVSAAWLAVRDRDAPLQWLREGIQTAVQHRDGAARLSTQEGRAVRDTHGPIPSAP